jgi:uncharacterized SAM-binding protein YcdF (DUF218 family)
MLAVFVLLIAWPFIAWAAARALIVRMPLPMADAIVVLSGSAAYKERTQLAAKLYRDRTATRLILTNDNQKGPWSSAEQRNPFYYERAIDELCALGVPKEHIEVLPQAVSNTYEEAVLLHDYTKAQGLHNVLVVTSAYHSRRALWTLRRVFKDGEIQIGLEPVPTGFQTPSSSTWWLYPNGWQLVFGEYFKIVHYRLTVV